MISIIIGLIYIFNAAACTLIHHGEDDTVSIPAVLMLCLWPILHPYKTFIDNQNHSS